MTSYEQTVPSEDPNNYCRLCFSDRNLVALFPSDAEPRQFLLDQISYCIGIRIEEVESYPRSVCWRCAVALEDFQLFRERSLAHDAIIREKYAPTSTVNVTKGNTEWMISIPAPETPANDGAEEEKDDKALIEPIAKVESDSRAKHERFSSSKMDKMNVGDSKSTTCNLCKHDFVSRQSLYSHFKEQHSDRGRPHKCDLCEASFKRRSHLVDHQTSHTGVRYDCKDCGAIYAKSKSLIRHRKVAHPTAPFTAKNVNKSGLTGGEFQCKYCPKSFKHRPSLNFHLKSHYDKLPLLCELCDARFANEKGIQVHRRKYHPDAAVRAVPPSSKEPQELIPCTLCPRTFEHRRYLTQHMKFIHPNCSDETVEGAVIAEQQSSQQETGGLIQMNDGLEPVTIKFEVEETRSEDGAGTDYSE